MIAETVQKFFSMLKSRMIYRVQATRVLRSVALSFVSIYVPVFLLTHGFSLRETILFFVVLHGVGLLAVFVLVVPMIRKWGMVRAIRWHFPLQMLFLGALLLGGGNGFSVWIAAVIGGIASMLYNVPLNVLFMRYTDREIVAKDFSLFFALPKIFGFVGPLLGAFLVVFVGFWATFVVAFLGLFISALPLRALENDERVDMHLFDSLKILWRRKFLFFLEGFDNIVEESEWLWGIIVFLLIGSLATPGIVGSLEALGGAVFTIFVGRYVNKQKSTIVILSASMFLLALVWGARFFIATPLPAYLITVVSSFVMTLFLVSYFAMIYRKVKGDQDAEFIILREIPTVVGRMIVFGIAILVASDIERFFYLPIAAMGVLLIAIVTTRKYLASASM
jgi:hypothetical protein